MNSTDHFEYRFISRATPKDPGRHVILGVIGYKPREFASQMNLSLSNQWGIVRTIIDMCMSMPEGKYVLVKVRVIPEYINPIVFIANVFLSSRIQTSQFSGCTRFLPMPLMRSLRRRRRKRMRNRLGIFIFPIMFSQNLTGATKKPFELFLYKKNMLSSGNLVILL